MKPETGLVLVTLSTQRAARWLQAWIHVHAHFIMHFSWLLVPAPFLCLSIRRSKGRSLTWRWSQRQTKESHSPSRRPSKALKISIPMPPRLKTRTHPLRCPPTTPSPALLQSSETPPTSLIFKTMSQLGKMFRQASHKSSFNVGMLAFLCLFSLGSHCSRFCHHMEAWSCEISTITSVCLSRY